MNIATDAITAAAHPQTHGDIAGGRPDTARDHAAAHQACLAMSRWSSGLPLSELAAAPSTVQARWHAQRQEEFTSWLASGGFAQDAAYQTHN